MPRATHNLFSPHHPNNAAHFAIAFFVILTFPCVTALATKPDLAPRPSLQNALGPLVENFCLDCHSGEEAEAEFAFEPLLANPQVNQNRLAWQKVLKHLRGHTMPPEDAEAPSIEARSQAVAWLETELSNIDCSGPTNPGRVTIRRLNRIEYGNTIRDLLGVEFDPTETFPRDTVGYGYDNIGDVLSLSPLLVEKYLDAAEAIAAKAILTPESIQEPSHRYPAAQLQGGDYHEDMQKLYANGRVFTTARFLKPGNYLLRARVYAMQAGDELAKMRFDLNNQPLRTIEVADTLSDWQDYFVPFEVESGSAEIGVSFLNDLWNPEAKNPKDRDRNLYVKSLEVVGPLDLKIFEAGRDRVISATPTPAQWQHADQWREVATTCIRQFLSRAYRRPASDEQIERAMQLVSQSQTAGDSYQRAMQLVVKLALVSPNFLFRGELPSQEDNNEGPIQLDEYQLATRLSYFLWSSMPDEQLFEAAAEGTLRSQLDMHVQRMLASPRADQLIRNFGEQWLETRLLISHEPSAELFPEFDRQLAEDLREETFLLLQDVFRNNLPISTLLSAEYSYLNSRLASHYGFDAIQGEHFRKVTLPVNRQAGLLTHGSVLAVTSHPDRTSPVLRGKWILQHLLNDAPPPPPVVADLAEDPESTTGKSLRQRLEIHRSTGTCNVCHQVMDPLGFALENYDPLGRWRETDGEFAIDNAGQLPDGRKFSGATGLRDLLLADLPALRKCLAEQLLIYALGRGLEYYDQCTVREIATKTLQQGDTITGIVTAIVDSAAFQQTQVDTPE